MHSSHVLIIGDSHFLIISTKINNKAKHAAEIGTENKLQYLLILVDE